MRWGQRLKYGNRITERSGETFHSKAEADRYGELLWLQEVGEISGLVRQPSYTIYVEGERITRYVGDFEYYEHSSGLCVVEDVKGAETEGFKLKAKLFRATIKNRELRIIKMGKRA